MANPFDEFDEKAEAANPFDGIDPAPAPAPKAEPPKRGFGSEALSFAKGMRQSLYDIPQSIIELGLRGADAAGITKGAYPAVHQMFAEEAPKGDKFFSGGRLGGNIATTAPLTGLNVLKGATLAPRVVNAAAQGGLGSLLTSTGNEGSAGTNAGIGAGIAGAIPVVGAVVRGAAKAVPYVLGNMTTGAGKEAVSEAFRAGREGGKRGEAMAANMRGTVPMEDVVGQAKAAVRNMRAERGKAYRSGMADISQDKAILDFAPIDEARVKSASVKTFKGEDLSPKTAAVRQEITEAIDKWKGLDPAEYHTPEGMDALKQIIGDIRDDLPFNTPQRAVADSAYSAIRESISKQAPAYDKVMGDYSKASDLISQIEKELSVNPKANINTTLRKLQSVMRDNANTSWGKRADYARTLEDAGAETLMPSLAGQSLSSMTPRGLNRLAATLGAGGSYMFGSLLDPVTLSGLAATSPRLVGETAYGLGKARGALPQSIPSPAVLAPSIGALSSMTLAPAQ